MGMKRTIIISTALLVACTIAIIIAISINTRTISEQNFQQCIAEAGGYQSTSLDEMIAIRSMCDGYLQ